MGEAFFDRFLRYIHIPPMHNKHSDWQSRELTLKKRFLGPIRPLLRTQWPRSLRRQSAYSRLLGLPVRIPTGAWISLSSEFRVLSGSSICAGSITRPEESYRVWCVWVWSWSLENEEALAHWGLLCYGKKKSTPRYAILSCCLTIWRLTATIWVVPHS